MYKIMAKFDNSHSVVGMGGDKVHLLCCYHACICPFFQSKSPTAPTRPLGHASIEVSNTHTGQFSNSL